MGRGGRCYLRISSAVLIFLCSALSAQKVRVPFVGCPAEGQSDPWKAPTGTNKAVEIGAKEAQKLAYYKPWFGSGVHAPRDWHCFATYGSDGVSLFVSPRPIKLHDLFGLGRRGFTGPVVQIDNLDGSTSGRFEVAQVVARAFPARKAFVTNVIEIFGGASDYKFGPYPQEKVIVQTDRLVDFRTPPHSEGLGTMSRLKANNDPVDGVAILDGPTLDLLMLRVRLPRELSSLAPAIIHEFERR